MTASTPVPRENRLNTEGYRSGKDRNRRRGLNASGFTLLELTISMTLLALVVVIILGAMQIGIRSVESGEKKIESFQRLRASMQILDSQIQSHVPLTYVQEGEAEVQFYFRGERQVMQFATNYSIWGGEKGFVLAAYEVRSDESGRQSLTVTENVVNLESKRETTLFETFENISFEYFYRDPFEETGQWVEQWTEKNQLPEKIRMHFIDGPRDLSLIIPVRVRGSLTDAGQFVAGGEE
ncbi:MAG: prepilin-type N-terminal cleavage/methylation domain-containing protein [Nitrospirota bacterium]